MSETELQVAHSMRGVKEAERLHYRENLIARYVIDECVAEPVGEQTHVHKVEPDFGNRSLQQVLRDTPEGPLLWTYADRGLNQAQTHRRHEITFGYDLPVDDGDKIGHAALTGLATIAGEIHPYGTKGDWIIGNQSGAWGAMPAKEGHGKTDMLGIVANCMNNHLAMGAHYHDAVSSNSTHKRELQLVGQMTHQKLMNFVRRVIG